MEPLGPTSPEWHKSYHERPITRDPTIGFPTMISFLAKTNLTIH